ncbi:MurR/RpiR family transcriptional regulator [Agrobacterium rhizogenes]|uniref:MurR/RpiR family transcriptional regulator n=1 Tax=Rhizobium rhizogenes TaxID=359 RepID=UPI0015728840|nr:MurR/RpiR family transcriptional regulator [Rhizobium rhizogenes]NTH16600.1 MurR/RpiR family transcriptional regulator [Rhizobium rhizogenes]
MMIVRRQVVFTKGEEKVARLALDCPEIFAFETAKMIGRKSDTSATTVSKAVTKMGFETFKQSREVFRIELQRRKTTHGSNA